MLVDRRMRFRDLGFTIGDMQVGRYNAITDVPGVSVGFSTLVSDDETTARTGVTAIWPRGDEIWHDGVFAGVHCFNGYGDITGLSWIAEQGLINEPIALTNTYSVGIVRDTICAHAAREMRPYRSELPFYVNMPVVSETYDGFLSDIEAQLVTADMAYEALNSATSGPVAEGNVGGGTGMICHQFKGGTGTSSRVTASGYTLGVLVQANYGRREHLRIAGSPIGEHITTDIVPAPLVSSPGSGSIVVVIATDAPLVPIQCQRLARRATIGLGQTGGFGEDTSGDIFLAFSTANHIRRQDKLHKLEMIAPPELNPLFLAAAEATHEAIVNALCMAEPMSGRRGCHASALPLDRLKSLLAAK